MKSGIIKKFKTPKINPFDFQIKYTETDRNRHRFEIDMHAHTEFEIYINLSGDVSFLVNNRLYPLTRGDIIISRPGEMHHCVYHNDAKHKLVWILFDCKKNPEFFEHLIHSDINYISPSENLKTELAELCFSLLKNNQSDFDNTYSFLRILKIIQISSAKTLPQNSIPKDFIQILNYIDEHITENLTVTDISNGTFLSTSTIERRFKKYANLTPIEFVQKKKMCLAAEKLRKGESVLSAGESVGYDDNSYFIQIFKRCFKITPYQYKKTWIENNSLKF